MTDHLTTRDETSQRLVRKLWQYCNILRDDGLSNPNYVEQLTYLLFLKMSDEQPDGPVPASQGWRSFAELGTDQLHQQYSRVLTELSHREGMLGLIFKGARNKIKDPAKLRLLVVDLIGQTAWSGLSDDVKGDAYEGLLEKNARDTKSGAGQYFTPRSLIRAIVKCIDPKPDEVVCDPACGTGGFLLAAHQYISRTYPPMSVPKEQPEPVQTMRGVELVEEVARLAAMNLLLHGVGTDTDKPLPISCNDSLRSVPEPVDVVLTNPPFGVRGSVTYSAEESKLIGDGLKVIRPDFWVETANKQLNFLQHVCSMLKPGARAAIVVPDNVLFESGAAAVIRGKLLSRFDVHTLLRLPPGLFYAAGVKSNVLFFDRLSTSGDPGNSLWVYDLRTDNRYSLKTRPLLPSDLHEFVEVYRPEIRGDRKESSSVPRWRAFDRKALLEDPQLNLDLRWSVEDRAVTRSGRLAEISQMIIDDLQRAVGHIAEASAIDD